MLPFNSSRPSVDTVDSRPGSDRGAARGAVSFFRDFVFERTDWDAGATFVEGSICGIGGAIRSAASLGAVGNLATEDIVHVLNEMGIETGLTTDQVISAAWDVARLLDITPRSHVTASGTRSQIIAAARRHGHRGG